MRGNEQMLLQMSVCRNTHSVQDGREMCRQCVALTEDARDTAAAGLKKLPASVRT